MALTMWLLGAAVATAGSAVYLEYGTVSFLSSLRVLIYRSGAIGATSERRREELPRARLQTSQVYGDVCLCHVSVVHCEPYFVLPYHLISSPAIRDGHLLMRSSLVNVGIPISSLYFPLTPPRHTART